MIFLAQAGTYMCMELFHTKKMLWFMHSGYHALTVSISLKMSPLCFPAAQCQNSFNRDHSYHTQIALEG